jgi:ABC-type uncharacterized transport system ATPase component
MKTSLIIDNKVFQEAKKEAAESGKTVSEVISLWARVGREAWMKEKREQGKEFKPVHLGELQLDLSNRKNWMEELEDDRS